MDLNTEQFFSMALTTARRGLPSAQDARQAAREALQEAHSSLSQAAFFAALDALGGEEAALARLVKELEASPYIPLPRHEHPCLKCGQTIPAERIRTTLCDACFDPNYDEFADLTSEPA